MCLVTLVVSEKAYTNTTQTHGHYTTTHRHHTNTHGDYKTHTVTKLYQGQSSLKTVNISIVQ